MQLGKQKIFSDMLPYHSDAMRALQHTASSEKTYAEDGKMIANFAFDWISSEYSSRREMPKDFFSGFDSTPRSPTIFNVSLRAFQHTAITAPQRAKLSWSEVSIRILQHTDQMGMNSRQAMEDHDEEASMRALQHTATISYDCVLKQP
ncbi:hypothetical protein LTR17_002949 [Elasticomyces elasticus]|nr:hypothetical protein LTR17_002949 [Elasticomyces elasticus]